VRHIADFIGSTSQIINYAGDATDVETFIIGTEEGILHRLKKENPEKEFILAHALGICPNMKMTTLEHVYLSLRDEVYQVTVPRNIASKARQALEKMFKVT
jgi:quinolinate synthase